MGPIAVVAPVGGISAARKFAALREAFAIRTAWHGPGDTSSVGHADRVYLHLSCTNFGFREVGKFYPAKQDVFPGCLELKNGFYHAPDKPGFGIDVDEQPAAKSPATDDPLFDMNWETSAAVTAASSNLEMEISTAADGQR